MYKYVPKKLINRNQNKDLVTSPLVFLQQRKSWQLANDPSWYSGSQCVSVTWRIFRCPVCFGADLLTSLLIFFTCDTTLFLIIETLHYMKWTVNNSILTGSFLFLIYLAGGGIAIDHSCWGDSGLLQASPMEMFNYFKMIETVYGLFVVFHYDISMPWLDQSLDFKSTPV